MNVADQGAGRDRHHVVPRTLIFLTSMNPATGAREVLLLEGAPTKRLWAGRYNGLGGHVEAGEDVLAAARRELFEEAGLQVEPLLLRGVDGRRVEPAQCMAYKGVMLSGVPNFVYTFGYTNASWTLKADLTARWTCRLLQHLDRNGQAVAVAPRDPAVAEAPFLALSSGYVQRALELLPRQGTQAPWSVHQNYLADLRVLRFGAVDDGTLRLRPVPELTELRRDPLHVAPCLFQPGDANPLAELRGGRLEIEAVLEPAGATAFGLHLVETEFLGRNSVSIHCDVAAGTISLNHPHVETEFLPRNSVSKAWHTAPLPAGPVRLRVFIDCSVVEVFVDDRAVLSARVYPERPEAMGVELFAEGGAVRVEVLEAWPMDDIWAV